MTPHNRMDLWHCRMGHLNSRDLLRLQTLAEGVLIKKPDQPSLCSSCCKAKLIRQPFANKGKKALRVFQYLYTDLVGPYPVPTPSGYRYYLGITDKKSDHEYWVFLLQRKSDAVGEIIGFGKKQEQQNACLRHARIEFFSSDNGGEFIDSTLQSFWEIRASHTSFSRIIRRNTMQLGSERTELSVFRVASVLLGFGYSLCRVYQKQVSNFFKPGTYDSL